MRFIHLKFIFIYTLFVICYKNDVIAANEQNSGNDPPAESNNKDIVKTSDTQIIEIKVNKDTDDSDTSKTGIKVEEVKSSDSHQAIKPKDSTIATITVNIPNQNEKTIQIKNVEPSKPEADKDSKKVPVKDDDDEDDKDQSFIHKIIKFIRSDFRFLVKFGAVLSSTLTQMIPLNLILTIRKNNSTKNLKCLNFVTSAVSSLSWSLYGALINLVGIWTFNKYCSDQNEKFILNVSSKVSAVLALVLLVLFFVLTSETFLTVVGLIGGSLLAMSYLSPLFSFKEILESRNTSTMPTEISLGNFISSFFMFCYGFIIWDMLVIAPSFLGVISGLIQLTLLFLFPHSDRIIISEVEILEQPNNFRSMLSIDQEV